jgi:formylglycine-generating enzyme required for sulfatase activity
VAPSKAFRYELVTRNWIDLFADWNEGIQRLVDRISSITGVAAPPQPPPRHAATAIAPIWIVVVAGSGVLVAAGSYFWLQSRHASLTTAMAAPAQTGPAASTMDKPSTQLGVQTAALIPVAPVKPASSAADVELKVSPPPAFDPDTHGGQIFKECKNCPEMVVVPRGSAILGSPLGEPGRQANEEPPHNVVIPQPFAVGRFTVTFDEWDACVADGGCNNYSPDDDSFGRGRRPVIFVSWDDAQAYVDWLKKKTGQPYRLLSEAEWEYAARGCTTTSCPNTPFWFGTIRPEVANYDSRYAYEGSPKAERQLQTMPVDQASPNRFGLYNMLGNVQQWVEDCWNPSPAPGSDPAVILTGDCADRVIRGGSWADKPADLRAAARSWDTASDRESPNIGIRVARTLSP